MANYDEIIKNIQDDRTSAAAASSRFSERNPVLLRYPLNNQQDYGGTITFKARKPQFDTLGSKAIEFLAPDFGGAPPSGFPLSDPLAEPGRPGGFNENLYKSKVDRKVTRTERLRPEIGTNRKCTLYLPGAIQIADKVSYSNVDLGILGAGIRQGILDQRSAGEIISDVAGGIKDTFGSLINSLRTGVGSEEAQIAAQRVFGASSTISGAISSATGVAVNPNRRAVLSGPELRNFAFTFRLVPTSPAEAESIEKIIQFFREEMYPDAVETAGVSAAFRYPSIFDIVMRYRTARGQYKKVATQLLPSFLQAVDVNYNQSGMSFHRDGKPLEATLTLNFTEERTLNRYDVAVRGY